MIEPRMSDKSYHEITKWLDDHPDECIWDKTFKCKFDALLKERGFTQDDWEKKLEYRITNKDRIEQ